MRDYREKDVAGYISDMKKPFPYLQPCNVTVRMTSDEHGKTLSLAGANILIGIPLEAVADIVKVVEE